MSARDYAAEMRAIIDEATSHGPYAPPVVAQEIVDKLRVNDPDLLTGWLDAQAVNFVRDAINYRDRSNRTHARQTAGRSVFRENAEAFEAGDDEAMAGWLETVYKVEDGTKLALGEMFKPDLLYVADDYRRIAAENRMSEAFMRALAKKVGAKKVSEVFDEEKLAHLWDSIKGGQR